MSFLARVFRRKKEGPFDQLIDRLENDEDGGLFISEEAEAGASEAPEPLPTRETPPGGEEAAELPDIDAKEAAPEPTAASDEKKPAAEETGVDEAEADGEKDGGPKAPEAEAAPAPAAEVQTVSGGGGDDLSMFRASGADSGLLSLTEGIEDSSADELLQDAKEIHHMLTGGGA